MAENVLNRLLIFVGWVVALGYDVCWFSCYCVKKQRKAHQFETIFQIGKWVSGTHLKVGNKTKKQSIMKETEVMDAYSTNIRNAGTPELDTQHETQKITQPFSSVAVKTAFRMNIMFTFG